MAVKFANLASTTLASATTNSATSITVSDASSFPSLGGSDYFYASIGEGAASEIVKVTGVSSNTLTATRGQDGTTAVAHSSGTVIALRVVAAALDDIASQAQTAADTESVSIAGDTMTGGLTLESTLLSKGHSSGDNWMPYIDGNFYIRAPLTTFDNNVRFSDGSGVLEVSGDNSGNHYLEAGSGQIRIRPNGTTTNKIVLDSAYINAPAYQVAGTTVIDSDREGSFATRASFGGIDSDGNNAASANELVASGYGLMGNRATLYITNANAEGVIKFGIGGVHNATGTVALTITDTQIDAGSSTISSGPINSGTISSGAITSTGAITVNQNGDALNLRSTTNAQPVRITFSSDVPAAQIGYVEYVHSDADSYGSGEALIIGGNQSSTSILADGKLMFRDGIYSKPASGTGAGTLLISSSGNLTNIGTISSGSITTSGLLNFTANPAYIRNDQDNAAQIIISVKNSSGVAQQVRWDAANNTDGAFRPDVTDASNLGLTNRVWKTLYVNNIRVGAGNTLFADASRNITAGTISSGAITSTGTSTFGGVQIGGTTVISSSRNLTNIGTITSSSATLGSVAASANVALQVSPATGSNQSGLKVTNTDGGAHTWLGYYDGNNYLTGDADVSNGGITYIRSESGGAYSSIASFSPTSIVFNKSITSGAITSTGTGTFDELTLTGGTDNLTFTEASGDWSITNAQQGNGLKIYDGASGVEINYNNARLASFSDTGVHIGDAVAVNSYGELQLNQTANNDESGIAVLDSTNARSMRLWCDTTTAYINSGNGGSGDLKFNQALTVSAAGNLSGVGTVTSSHAQNDGFKITATDSTANAAFSAMKLDYNLSGTDACTTDRNHIGIHLDIDSSASGGLTNHEHRIYGIFGDVRASGDSDLVWGAQFNARVDDFGAGNQITQMGGVYGQSNAHNADGIVATNYGSYGYGLNNSSGTGQVSNTRGATNLAYAASTSTYNGATYIGSHNMAQVSAAQTANISQVVGVWGEVQFDNDAAADHDVTVLNAFVFRAEYDENDSDDSYTVNTGYLYYGNYAGTQPTTAYGVYIADGVRNYFGGSLTAGLGSTTTASYGFNGDINTGMYAPANHEVAFLSNGQQKLRVSGSGVDVTGAITTSGRIDIVTNGTVSEPYAAFGVTQTSSTSSAGLFLDAAGGRKYEIQSNAGNELIFYDRDSSAYRLRIMANGNLKIESGNLQMSGTTVIDSSRNLTNIGTISSGAITARANGGALKVYSATTQAGARVEFSDLLPNETQKGYLTYYHADSASYGAGNSFVFSGTESSLSVFVDGQVLSKNGFYIGPASGTGAGTQVIDSSRNLTNIGTISSGGITTIGASVFNGTSATDPDATSRTRYPAANMFTHTSQANGVSIIGGQGSYTGCSLTIGEETGRSANFKFIKGISDTNGAQGEEFSIDGLGNATFAGTISSGAITSSAKSTFSGGLDTNNSQYRVKISPWTGTTYGYGMKSGMTFGGLANNYALTFQMNSSTGRGFWWGQDAHSDAQGAMALTNDGKLTVSHSLRLGHGVSDTTTPGATHALDVSGSIASTGAVQGSRFADASNPTNYFVHPASVSYVHEIRVDDYIRHNGDTNTHMLFTADRIKLTAGNILMLDCVEGGTDYIDIINRVRVTAGGDLECEGNITAYTTTSISDINQKENIQQISDPIEKVKQISGYTFDWKNSGEHSGGVIAQEVEQIMPDVVKEVSIRDGDEMKAVDYQAIIGLLVETVKDLNKRIEDLENGNN